LTAADIEDIRTVLKNVVRTSLSESEVPLDDAALEERISVFANEFKGRADYEEPTEGMFSKRMDSVPAGVLYTIAGGGGGLIIGGIFVRF
ncbi:hypothetical protein R0J91_16305, partial [Micrococcus sp. SIMBA_131]